MATASTTTPAMVRSSSRRQPSYTAPTDDRARRAPSITSKPSVTPGGPPRSHSQTRPSSSSQQTALAGVARRDHETTNVARPQSSSRRSSSRDASYATPTPKRTDSTRESRHSSSRPNHSRNNSRMPATEAAAAPAPSVQTPAGTKFHPDTAPYGSSGSTKRRTTVTAQTGEWTLGKTIGAGSMGKVKLAKNLETGEQVG
jgi:serine/threonine protein kinase KIN1/2